MRDGGNRYCTSTAAVALLSLCQGIDGTVGHKVSVQQHVSHSSTLHTVIKVHSILFSSQSLFLCTEPLEEMHEP